MAGTGHNLSRTVVVLTKPRNRGFVDSANVIFNLAGRADVVLVNSDVEVAADWLVGLQTAAFSSSLVATASALSNHGGILSVPTRNVPDPELPQGSSLLETAERVRRGSARLWATIPTALGHCVYIRRIALDVVGYFDTAFAPGYEEEVDWSLRAVSMGFEHVVADDVYVYHRGGASFGESPERSEQKNRNLRELVRRYPYHLPQVGAVEDDRTSSLAACLLAARRSIKGLTVVVDGMCLGHHQTGTQTLVVHLTRALALQERVAAIHLLVPGALPEYAATRLGDLEKLSLQPTVVGNRTKGEGADVVLRPYQFSSEVELEWLREKGDRLALIQLDLIAYSDPAYFLGYHQWQAYRDLQRLAFLVADGVAFISDTVRRQARDSGLLPAGVPTCVTYLGVDEIREVRRSAARPSGCERVSDGFLLVLGASFLHKNRVWAIRLAEELVSEGWAGHLILAGPTPSYGSSRKAEADYLKGHAQLNERVIDVGPVSSQEKDWLYLHSGLVLYPTMSEGFGMVPFEAADYGTPCLSTRQGSLDEVLPQNLVTLDSLALAPACDLVLKILDDRKLSEAIVSSLRAQRAKYNWGAASDEIAELMWSVTARPRTNVVAIEVARGRLTLRATPQDRWLPRLVEPLAAYARRSENIQGWVLPSGTRRGDMARLAYHRVAGDERPSSHRRAT
jgi:glycosyltransferase involved in cell wall biosynthesis